MKQTPQQALGDSPDSVSLTEDWLSLGLVGKYGEWLRFIPQYQKWYRWNGSYWERDDAKWIIEAAKILCRQGAQYSASVQTRNKLLSKHTITAIEHLARTDPGLVASLEVFDGQLSELNTPLGIIDLRTGILGPAEKTRYHTKVTAVEAVGECPLFMRFLDRITDGDLEYQRFLQRHAGYCALGHNLEAAFFFLYGGGQNGKSVYLEALAGVLGTYASVVPAEAFLENSRGYERHPTELADLVGIRMATASEIEKGRRWNETRITQLTGGDRVSARHMREDYFKFTCRAKFNVMANNKPGFRGVNKALLRRIYLLPFSVQITEEEKDKQLPLKLIPEYPGILAWAVKGAQLYLEKGLDPPSFVKEATTSYMDDQDVVGTWFRDHMIFDSTAGFISYADVYARYSAWARTAGEYVESLHNFNDLLHTKFNVTKSKSNNHRGFTGVRERKDSDPETI